jgi:ABC-type nitrate/sulfonate/bicarbonate transport system permease component
MKPRGLLGWTFSIGGPGLVFFAVFALWQISTSSGWVNQLVLPGPGATFGAFFTDGADLADNALVTTIEAVTGMIVGNLIGLVLAVVFVHSPLIRRTIYPLAMAAKAVPIVAVAPALIIVLGNGMSPKILVTIFLVFFPMLVNAMRGLRSADAELSELLYTLSATRWQALWMVRLPASMPYVFSALKLSACACFVSAIVSEWVASDRGLGYLIVFAGSQFRTDVVWAAVLVGTVLSMAMVALVVVLERVATPWLARQQHLASA